MTEMNHYDARAKVMPHVKVKGHKLPKGLKAQDVWGWHYTCRNDEMIWPVGYCVEHDPHPTADEAYACITNYVLDHVDWNMTLDTKTMVPRCDYPNCRTLVDDGGGASCGVGGRNFYVLCFQHRNRDDLARVLGTIGRVVSSC